MWDGTRIKKRERLSAVRSAYYEPLTKPHEVEEELAK
jgi:hypothetical protein